jgi:tape measure domain-containing protein
MRLRLWQLKVLARSAEGSIEKMIVALGRLQLGFKNSMGSSSDFLLNLQQLFDQGFEAQDWKQAIGRVQIFEQLMEKAFGTKDPAKLKEMKAAGKLTMDTFIDGFAEAASSDTRLAGLSETFSSRLSKVLTEVNLQLAPLGDRIAEALKPAMDAAMAEFAKPNPQYFKIFEEFGKSPAGRSGKD